MHAFRKLRRERFTTFALLSLAAACLVGCRKTEQDKADLPVAVTVVHPAVGDIAAEIFADGILGPIAQAALVPRISAPIRAEYVKRGDHVHAGQTLLTMESRDLQGGARDSKGALATAEAAYETAAHATAPEDLQKAQFDLDQAKANLEVANRTATERKRLFEQGGIAGRDADSASAAAVQAQAAYDIAVKHLNLIRTVTGSATVKSAEGQLTSAQGRYESAAAQAEYATLRSPIDGVVTERPFYPGETPTAGTAAVTVMDTSSLLAKMHLAQSAAQTLRVGGTAKVQVPGLATPLPASITFISPALDSSSTTVEVWLKVANADTLIKAGTPVHATMEGVAVRNTLQVPVSAILPSQNAGETVMVVSNDGTAHIVPVKVGIRTTESAQILSGLKKSDAVIVSGSYGLYDGTKVTPGAGKPSAGELD